MIRFGLRLTLAGGREAAVRLVVIALAVALGAGMLLLALAGLNGVTSQNDRYGWANSADAPGAERGADPLWWQLRVDGFDRRTVGRVDLAATGPNSPVPPGLPRLPGPGEYYASPALVRLIAATPAAELADRFPGRRLAGTIGPAALPAPDSLVAVVGYTPAELSRRAGVSRVGTIATTAPTLCPNGCWSGIPAAGLQLVLSVVAAALIFPLFILIGTATRLAATRREQRFAAMRLVGATPAQVSVVAAVESTVSALAGTVLGFALFFAFRDTFAAIPLTGAPMFPADLALDPVTFLGVALGVPLIAALAARLALRRVRISPLGVTRRVTPRPPRAWRLIPLALGLAELAYFVGRRPGTTNGQILAFLPGIFVIMIGLIVAGPWLTMAGSRLVAGRADRPAALIAARRLADNPRAGFRSVSGLVLALFVTSVAVGVMGSIAAQQDTPSRDRGAAALFTLFRDEEAAPTGDPVPAALLTQPGVLGNVVTRIPPESVPVPKGQAGAFGWPYLLASCAEIARLPDFTQCAAGARTAWVWPDLTGPDDWTGSFPAADVDPASLLTFRVQSIVTVTDGSTAALETARTTLELAHPMLYSPYSDVEFRADTARVFEGWKRLANVVILASLAIAGCSLAVSVAGGLSERKRPFSMLRLTGVSLGTLRRVVLLESVTPLVIAAVVALGAGLVAAHLFLTAQMQLSLSPPAISFYAIVAGGLAASLAVIASTMPLLRRITGPEAARNE
ncbi:ABC transporter permease [Actinoplanes sp. ATCC 53533]|uniref:FtsX-like permease family protein n=1 Tax=Actinoplanes sp. ATCC 53533 TaxID=1288362 RepID=UPI000F7B6C1B|nr:FtsX-like permease family protein [Actinoplanes sp. ATCC 53533]RSM53859.1 ABC transporter permease [Actinoplanes sp. ATCC 53533]